jgi:hypothetical protein
VARKRWGTIQMHIVKMWKSPVVENRSGDGSGTEDENFGWMGVLSNEAKGSQLFVVYLVYVFIHETQMEELVSYETRM